MICFRNPHLKTLYKYWKKLFASTQKFKKRTWTVEEVFSLSLGVMQMSFDTGELFKYTFILLKTLSARNPRTEDTRRLELIIQVRIYIDVLLAFI